MFSFLKSSEKILDSISEYSGRVIAWLVLVLVLLVCFEAGILRLVLKAGAIRDFFETSLLPILLQQETIAANRPHASGCVKAGGTNHERYRSTWNQPVPG